MIGVRGPRRRILGFYAAGEVAAVGAEVTRFKPGDRVVGSHGFKFGCHAEYVVVAEDGLIAKIPDNLGYPEAVGLCFGGVTALYFFRLGKLGRGEKILINGAAGAVGSMAVQLAKQMGDEVTGVCSGPNVKVVKSLGADEVVDYTLEDFTHRAERYDLIMDTHGNTPYSKVKRVLKPGGRFLMVIGDLAQMVAGARHRNVIAGSENDNGMHLKSLVRLMNLAEAGQIRSVGATMPFHKIVEAYRLVDSGHKIGNVVLVLE
jgi:NADPH:quinone reductase-like Zn-dependent oxidoreductase